MMKTLVLGLDGANWELLDPWLEAGELPNLKRLKEKGAWSDQESQLPPVTFPNWKCYSTGRTPAQLGVYWFLRLDKDRHTIETIDSTDFRGKEIWDYLGEAGYTIGIINMPTTYPPKKVNGFMVCGGPNTRETEYRSIASGFSYPQVMEEELEAMDYRVHPQNLPTSKQETGKEVDDVLDLIEKRFELAKRKLDEVDFLHVTLFYLNTLQHFFWNGEPTKRAWKLIDDKLGELMSKDINLILMSDHGCCQMDYDFNINSWLEQEGYLDTNVTSEDLLQLLGINKERLYRWAKKIGIADFLVKITPKGLQRIIPREIGVKRERKADKIDWEKTAAVGGNQGTIYLLDPEKEEEISNKLRELRGPDGNKIATAVYTYSKLYGQQADKNSPDLVFDQRQGIHTNAVIGQEEIFTEEVNWRAENKRTGMFLAYGPDFKQNRGLETSILDLTPTILHLHGLPVPDDLKGRVLTEIFSKESEAASRTVQYTQTSDSEIEEMKGLDV